MCLFVFLLKLNLDKHYLNLKLNATARIRDLLFLGCLSTCCFGFWMQHHSKHLEGIFFSNLVKTFSWSQGKIDFVQRPCWPQKTLSLTELFHSFMWFWLLGFLPETSQRNAWGNNSSYSCFSFMIAQPQNPWVSVLKKKSRALWCISLSTGWIGWSANYAWMLSDN